MKKLLVILAAFFFLFGCAEKKFSAPKKEKTPFSHFSFPEVGGEVVRFSAPFSFYFFSKNPPSLEKIGEKHALVMNASFFGGDRQNAIHAGFLKKNGRQISPVWDDPQLTHIFHYNPKNLTAKISPVESFQSDKNFPLEFQTGPLVLNRGKLDEISIQKSKNGRGKYRRTLLGFDDEKNFFFIIVKKPVALDDLGKFFSTKKVFQNATIINLDGGPSTAIFSRDFPEINFRERQKMPFVLAVK